MMPNVQCLFYHTKQGAKNLAYFDYKAPGAWRWAGNQCARSVCQPYTLVGPSPSHGLAAIRHRSRRVCP
jgi:hypothetical protein